MNRQEIRLAVQDRLRDTAGDRTTQDEINRYIDDGYTDLAERSGAVVRLTTINCPVGEHFIPLPADCLYPIVLRDLASKLPIDFKDWPYIDKRDPNWIRRSSSFPRLAAMWGLGEILIHESFSSTGSIELIYAAVPSPLADGDTPELPAQHHQALVHYCHYRALLKEAHDDLAGKRLGRAEAQLKQYSMMAGVLHKWSMDRHGAMQLGIYGESLRKPEITAYPELQSSWRGPVS